MRERLKFSRVGPNHLRPKIIIGRVRDFKHWSRSALFRAAWAIQVWWKCITLFLFAILHKCSRYWMFKLSRKFVPHFTCSIRFWSIFLKIFAVFPSYSMVKILLLRLLWWRFLRFQCRSIKFLSLENWMLFLDLLSNIFSTQKFPWIPSIPCNHTVESGTTESRRLNKRFRIIEFRTRIFRSRENFTKSSLKKTFGWLRFFEPNFHSWQELGDWFLVGKIRLKVLSCIFIFNTY